MPVCACLNVGLKKPLVSNLDPSPHSPVSDEIDDDGFADEPEAERLNALYKRYFTRLVSGLRVRYGSGPPDPQDVAQQTFERLHQRDTLDDIGNLQSYAWIIANNIVHSEMRAIRVRERHAEEERTSFWGSLCDEIDPERVISAREELEIVVATISAMSERRREIFLACRFHGLTPEQAGKRVGVSRSSAMRHIAVANAILIEALVEHHEDSAPSQGRPA